MEIETEMEQKTNSITASTTQIEELPQQRETEPRQSYLKKK